LCPIQHTWHCTPPLWRGQACVDLSQWANLARLRHSSFAIRYCLRPSAAGRAGGRNSEFVRFCTLTRSSD
jgi:hypothetical protein